MSGSGKLHRSVSSRANVRRGGQSRLEADLRWRGRPLHNAVGSDGAEQNFSPGSEFCSAARRTCRSPRLQTHATVGGLLGMKLLDFALLLGVLRLGLAREQPGRPLDPLAFPGVDHRLMHAGFRHQPGDRHLAP